MLERNLEHSFICELFCNLGVGEGEGRFEPCVVCDLLPFSTSPFLFFGDRNEHRNRD